MKHEKYRQNYEPKRCPSALSDPLHLIICVVVGSAVLYLIDRIFA